MKQLLLWGLTGLLLNLNTPNADAARKIRFTKLSAKSKIIDIKKLGVKPASTTSYTQSWNIWAWNDQGYVIYGLVVLTKIFMGMRMAVQLTIRTPDGKVKHTMAEYSKGKYSWDKNRLRVWVPNKHVFQFNKTKGLFIARFGKWGCRLRLKRVLPGFRFARGVIKFGSRKFDGVNFAPRMEVKGRLMIGGKKLRFKGVGYADYGWQNIMPQNISKRWLAARSLSKDYTIIGAHLLPSAKWRPRSVPILAIAKNGTYIFQGDHRQIKFSARRRKLDKESGYMVPQYSIFRGEKKGLKVKLEVINLELYDKFDVLSQFNAVLRMLVKRLISNPFLFRYRAKFILTMTRGSKRTRITRFGFTEFAMLNK